ncbi:MAG: hypothetical protein Q9220_007162 [cf. Caloplaca sp. 1 TL-2023]
MRTASQSISYRNSNKAVQEERRMSKFMQYATTAAQEALDDANWHPKNEEEQEMTGVCLGSGIGSFEEIYNTSLAFDKGVSLPNLTLPTVDPLNLNGQGAKKVPPLFVPKLLINLAAGHISMKFGLKGPSHAATTACTTGAHSIGDAARLIAHNSSTLMLAGGSESCIHPLALAAFSRLNSLSVTSNSTPHLASRPFDKSRSGFVISEGAAVLLLEELEHARARNAKIYAEVAGYGMSSDAHHITAPPKNGGGALRAMKTALRDAGCRPRDVGYINAHATGTAVGDRSENRAVKALMMGDLGKKSAGDINVSSTKGAVGHLLGAAGAVEALFSVLAIRDNIMPPTLNLTEVEGPEFDCNYVPLKAQEAKLDVVLSNSFGFGGTNASLCFKRYP